MNETPEGTPNPLSAAPEAAAPAPAPVAPEPVAPAAPAAPAAEPVAPAAPVAAAPKKKGKAGIIIGIILGVIALGCGIAAILFFFVFNKSNDPITDAMVKLLNGDNRNVAISGTYDYSAAGTPISIDFSAQMDTVAKAGIVTADISGSANGMTLNVNAEVRLPGDDKAYLKLSGIKNIFTDALKQAGVDCDATDCTSYLELMTSTASNGSSSMLGMFSSLFAIDGKWIMFEANIADSFSLPIGVKLDDVSSHQNEVVDTYKKYPFLKSSTNDLKISKKTDTLYKVEFDYDKLASFTNELASKNGSSQTVTASDLEKSMSNTGDIYVEIDGNNNFTRLYANEQDFTISYPSNINVVAPEDYTTSDALMEIFGSMFGGFTGGLEYDDDDDIIDYDDDGDDDYDFDWDWEEDEE